MGATECRENRLLGQEYQSRNLATTARMKGDLQEAAIFESRAEQYGYKAEQTHARRFSRGRTQVPYAHMDIAQFPGANAAAAAMITPPAVTESITVGEPYSAYSSYAYPSLYEANTAPYPLYEGSTYPTAW